MIPIECDICIVRKLRGKDPRPHSQQDVLLMTVIGHMSLDSFWSRSTETVGGNKNTCRQIIVFSATVGLYRTFVQDDSFTSFYHCGMR